MSAVIQHRQLPDATQIPVRPAKLAHLVMRVQNLQRSRDWYMQLLQAWPAFENEMLCFLAYDDEHHRLGLLAPPNLQPPQDNAGGLEHVAFTYSTLAALLATYRRLKAVNVVPYWSINHGPTISMYYKDPDGNRVELQFDVFDMPEDCDAFFKGGAYEENFMGIIFDPEEMVTGYERGDSIKALTARPSLPAGKTPWDMFVP